MRALSHLDCCVLIRSGTGGWIYMLLKALISIFIYIKKLYLYSGVFHQFPLLFHHQQFAGNSVSWACRFPLTRKLIHRRQQKMAAWSSFEKVVSPWFVHTPSCCSASQFSRCTMPAWYRDVSGGDSDGGKRSDMTQWLWSGNTTSTLTFLAKIRALTFYRFARWNDFIKVLTHPSWRM